MAIIHRATVTPGKLELVEALLGDGLDGSAELRQIGSYRFDDPAGQVGIEALLVTRGGPVRQVVLTYRPAPLDSAAEHLVTTMEHSVLGRRWVYDGQGDPVAVAAYQRALAGQQEQASLEIWDGDNLVGTRPPTLELSLHNQATDPVGLEVHLVTEIGGHGGDGPRLVAHWEGGDGIVAWA